MARRFVCSRCKFQAQNQEKVDDHILETNSCSATHYTAAGVTE